MITFPLRYPYEITNTTGSLLCGIPPAGTLPLGPSNIEGTKEFYETYAEEAFSYLLDGSLSAVDANGDPLVAYLAASSFTNMRAYVTNYEPQARAVQSYTKFSNRISVPGFFDEKGNTGAPGQSLALGTSGLEWDQGSLAYRGVFTAGNLSSSILTVLHNLDSEGFVCQVYDNSGKQIIPSDIQEVDRNTLRVDFTDMDVQGVWSVTVLASGKCLMPSNLGATGLQGPMGATGAVGLGVTGLMGVTGPAGSGTGDGSTGSQGVTGIRGTTGAQGATGTNGLTGAQGTTGAQGATGTNGLTGAQGITGAQGVTGTNGLTGAQGFTGAQGTTGARGVLGPYNLTISTTAPVSPTVGDVWIDIS